MRVLVCGGRDFTDRTMVFAALDKLKRSNRANYLCNFSTHALRC